MPLGRDERFSAVARIAEPPSRRNNHLVRTVGNASGPPTERAVCDDEVPACRHDAELLRFAEFAVSVGINDFSAQIQILLGPPDIVRKDVDRVDGAVRLSSEVKRRGGSVVAFVDNIPRRDFRQLAGAAAFRTIFRNRFDAVMVPGALGRVLAKKFGMASRGVFGGMYGADPEIFFPPPTNQGRADEFLFVGQFIERKGIDLLSRAFAEVRKRHPSYRLRMVGSGPLRGRLSADGAVVEDFLQPEEVSARYREAKFFVLPSRDEHWGLVVHEAALCGQVLLVSDAVGSAPDLVASDNGFVFRANDARALESAMESAIALDEINYDRMSERSRYNARAFGPQAWARSFLAILDYIGVSVERAPVLT